MLVKFCSIRSIAFLACRLRRSINLLTKVSMLTRRTSQCKNFLFMIRQVFMAQKQNLVSKYTSVYHQIGYKTSPKPSSQSNFISRLNIPLFAFFREEKARTRRTRVNHRSPGACLLKFCLKMRKKITPNFIFNNFSSSPNGL